MPLLNGHRLSERCGRWAFALMFGGFHLTFFPMHIAGLLGMPRRVYTYDAGLGWELPNLLSSAGAVVLAAGFLVLAVDVVRTVRRPKIDHANPWRAPTLEWIPSGNYATRSIAQVTSHLPLWQQPQLAEQVVAGQHWLPGTVTGLRETLVTSARRAELRHLIVLPGPSWWPLVGALGTAAFFLLLTVKWVLTAFAFGLLAVVAVLAWLWQTDRLPQDSALSTVEVGRGTRLPVGASLWSSHSWWATAILLVVDFTVLASMAFAHVHLTMRLEVCPPPGASLPPLADLLAVLAAFSGSAVFYAAAGWGIARGTLPRWRLAPLALAMVAAGAGGVMLIGAMADAGLAPRSSAWAASIAALLGYLGFRLAILAVFGLFLAARIGCCWTGPRQRATYDNTGLMWWGGCVQGMAIALLPHAMVWAMSPG